MEPSLYKYLYDHSSVYLMKAQNIPAKLSSGPGFLCSLHFSDLIFVANALNKLL